MEPSERQTNQQNPDTHVMARFSESCLRTIVLGRKIDPAHEQEIQALVRERGGGLQIRGTGSQQARAATRAM